MISWGKVVKYFKCPIPSDNSQPAERRSGVFIVNFEHATSGWEVNNCSLVARSIIKVKL